MEKELILKEINLLKNYIIHYKGTIISHENEIKVNNKNDLLPHYDLIKYFTENTILRKYVINILGLTDANENLLETEQWIDKKSNFIKINGAKFGKHDTIQFKGEYLTRHGLTVKFITPPICLNATVFGFEEEIQHIANDIIKESYEYINNNKTGNLTLM